MILFMLFIGAVALSVYCYREKTTPKQVYLRLKLYLKLFLIMNHLM